MFHSIKSKFLALCLSSLCVLGLAVGAVSLTALTRATSREEVDNMNRTAELYCSELDLKLVQTEDVVSFAATGLVSGASAGTGALWDGERRARGSRRGSIVSCGIRCSLCRRRAPTILTTRRS